MMYNKSSVRIDLDITVFELIKSNNIEVTACHIFCEGAARRADSIDVIVPLSSHWLLHRLVPYPADSNQRAFEFGI